VQLIHTAQGDIKVLHATPEQLARIQETHNIQVISEDQLLPVRTFFLLNQIFLKKFNKY
jgi:hypothetical protein